MKTIKIEIKYIYLNVENDSTMVKTDIFWVKEKNKKREKKSLLINKDDTRKNFTKKFNFFILKDFIFDKYIWQVFILTDIKRNCKKSRFI